MKLEDGGGGSGMGDMDLGDDGEQDTGGHGVMGLRVVRDMRTLR